jgi:DNA-directed RNA polymerase sigma subunit (sigma70/sigma32)
MTSPTGWKPAAAPAAHDPHLPVSTGVCGRESNSRVNNEAKFRTRLDCARNSFFVRYGRSADVTELAQILAVSEERIIREIRWAAVASSIYTTHNQTCQGWIWLDGEQEIHAAIFRSEIKVLLRKAVAGLGWRQEFVIRMRFGMGVPTDHTLEEVGTKLGITRDEVRCIETAALRKMKRMSGKQSLEGNFLSKVISTKLLRRNAG